MNEKTQTYWNEFWPVFRQEIILWFGWNDILKTIIKTGSQIFAICFVYFISENADQLVGAVTVLVIEWFFPFLVIYLILGINYIRASKKLYEGQKLIENRNVSLIKDLEFKLFPVESIRCEIDNDYRDAEGKQIISIKVTNLTSFDLVCFANATFILKWIQAEKEINEDLTYMTHPGSFFSWSGGSNDGLKNIYQNVPERINIADGKNRLMRFLLQKNMGYFEQYANATFIINIEIGGRLSDGRPIKTVPFTGTLEFHKAVNYLQFTSDSVFPSDSNSKFTGSDSDGNADIDLSKYTQYSDALYRLLYLKEGDVRQNLTVEQYLALIH